VIRAWYSLTYVLWLALEVLRQSVRLARDVLTPGLEVSPSIVEFPLRASSRLEVAAIESSITITPGTLTLGVYDPQDGTTKSLFVHFLYAHSHEDAVQELESMEKRLLLATRGRRQDRS
jgi:multicomponent Na+:H+ antiporter subunit E